MRQAIPEDMYAACIEMATKSEYTNRSLTEFLQHEIDEAKAWMDGKDFRKEFGDDIETARATAVHEIAVSARTLHVMEERREFLSKRLDHAIKCLKRKNLWADTSEKLMALCEDRGMKTERGMLQAVRCAFGCRIMEVQGCGELDDTCWRIGVDLAMSFEEPALAASDSLYGPALARNAGRIFVNVLMAAYGCKFVRMAEGTDYDDAIMDTLVEKYTHYGQDRLISAISGILASASYGRDDDLEAARRKLDAMTKKVSQLQAAMEERDRTLQKGLAPVQNRIHKIEEQAAMLEAENARLKAENEAMSDALAEKFRRLSELGPEAGQDLPELPEADVLFVGGHPNMTKKIAQDHPGWKFVDGGDKAFPEMPTVKLMFFWDKHLSHPTWERARRMAPAGTPQCYLKSTNIEMLEDEMRRGWAAVKPGGEEDDAGSRQS